MSRNLPRTRSIIKSAYSSKKGPLVASRMSKLLTYGYEQIETPEKITVTESPKIKNMANPAIPNLDIHGVFKQVAENTRITNETYVKTGYPRANLKNAIDPMDIAGQLMATEKPNKNVNTTFCNFGPAIAKVGVPKKSRVTKKLLPIEEKEDLEIPAPAQAPAHKSKNAYETFASRCSKLQSMKNKTPREQMELNNIIKPESIEVPKVRFQSISEKENREQKW